MDFQQCLQKPFGFVETKHVGTIGLGFGGIWMSFHEYSVTLNGYGCTAELERDSVIAVLAAGYADGLPRILSNNCCVKINNKICKITGRICMDMCMADITDLINSGECVNVGDEAIIYDEELIVNAAKNAHTVIHEILCLCSAPRVKHVFVG